MTQYYPSRCQGSIWIIELVLFSRVHASMRQGAVSLSWMEIACAFSLPRVVRGRAARQLVEEDKLWCSTISLQT